MAPRTQEGKRAKEKGLFDVKKKIYEMERNQMTIPRKGVSRKVIISWKNVLPRKVHTHTTLLKKVSDFPVPSWDVSN
jgi:hypothetical protein